MLGGHPAGSLPALDGIAFVAQDTPLYKNLSAADLLHVTRNLNRRFDEGYAEHRLGELGIPLRQKAGKMSGGQQAQLALTLALARRPQLLVLDEPMAMLDPLARHDFMATVMMAVADDGVSVVLSSHVLAELERVADYLVLLSRGSVQMVGEVDDLLATPSRAHRPSFGVRAACTRVERRAHEPCRFAGAPARSLATATSDPVPSGWEAAPGHARRADACLPARAQRRCAARPGSRAGTPNGRRWRGDRGDHARRAARPEEDASLRPLPWRRMAWVTWRQHRSALTGVGALLGALAVCFFIAGLQLHHAYAAAVSPATRPAHLPAVIWSAGFNGMYGFLANGFLPQVVPVLIGAFVGAPVLARELETGTYRFAWTQGFGRWRWTLSKLVGLAVVVAAAAGAISVLLSWYYQPYFNSGNQSLDLSEWTPLGPPLFDLRGVSFAAWTLAAFAIGALAGVLIRRVVPAIAATLAVYAGLALAAGGFLRQHYLTPLVTSKAEPARFRVDHQPAVDEGRPAGQPVRARPGPSQGHQHRGRERRGSEVLQHGAVPRPARVHAVDHLSAGQPVLAVPVDRGWLAARAVGVAHRRDRLACPPPRGLNAMSRARVGRKERERDGGLSMIGRSGRREIRGRIACPAFVRRSRRLGPQGPYSVAEPSPCSETPATNAVRSRRLGRSLRPFGLIIGAGAVVVILVTTLHRMFQNTAVLPGAERGHACRIEHARAHRGHRREPGRLQHRPLQLLLQQVQRLLGRRHRGLPER